MKSSPPNRFLLVIFAGFQLLAIVLAFTTVPSLIEGRSAQYAAVVLFVAIFVHFGFTWWTLDAADPSVERPAATSAIITVTLINVVAFPTEPRIAQGLCAAGFVGAIGWQVLLRMLDE